MPIHKLTDSISILEKLSNLFAVAALVMILCPAVSAGVTRRLVDCA